jgi:hypothetical protein
LPPMHSSLLLSGRIRWYVWKIQRDTSRWGHGLWHWRIPSWSFSRHYFCKAFWLTYGLCFFAFTELGFHKGFVGPPCLFANPNC